MSLYDWLLFLHVLAAFALVAALVVFWIIGIVARNVDRPIESLRYFRVAQPANVLVVVGTLGTLFILRGFMNLVFPETVQTLGDRMIASHAGVLAGAAVTIVLGAILSIMGYEHLWIQKSHRRSAARTSSAKRSAKRPRRKRG